MPSQEELRLIKKAAKGILKDCFWGDYTIDEKDTENIILNPYEDMELTKLVLSKILYNSRDLLFHLDRFPKEMVKDYIDNFRIGPYRKKEMEKRIAIIRIGLFDEKIEYKGLTWGA